MLNLARLVHLIGSRDSRGERAISRVAYALGDDGFIRVSRKGNRAAILPDEAAHLLLGIASGEPPASVARAVEAFANARARSSNWQVHGLDGCEAFDAVADACTLHEAMTNLLEAAPELVFVAERRATAMHPRCAEAAFDAAVRGLVLDVRVCLFRPQGVACVRLVDCTDERGPLNLATIWFDGAKLDPMPAGGSAITRTAELGLAIIAPIAFELRGPGRRRDADPEGDGYPPSGSTRAVVRANGHAAGPGVVHPEQRRETVQAADCARASHD